MPAHTSGLRPAAPGNSPFKVETDIDVIRRGSGALLLSKPGEKWSYSNLAYSVLAEVISQASGKPWSEFIAGRIFAPLGMAETRTADLIEIVPNRAAGYQFRDNRQRNVPPLLALRPSGAFLSTLRDLIRKTIALPPSALAAYAGQYQMSESEALTIAVDGPGLSVQSSAGFGQFRMLPETPSVFFISKSESYVFTREGNAVTQVQIRNGTAKSLGTAVLTARRLQ